MDTLKFTDERECAMWLQLLQAAATIVASTTRPEEIPSNLAHTTEMLADEMMVRFRKRRDG